MTRTCKSISPHHSYTENQDVPQEKVWEELSVDLDEPKKGEQLKQHRCTWVCAPCALPFLRSPVLASLGDRIRLKYPNSAVFLSQLETPKV